MTDWVSFAFGQLAGLQEHLWLLQMALCRTGWQPSSCSYWSQGTPTGAIFFRSKSRDGQRVPVLAPSGVILLGEWERLFQL